MTMQITPTFVRRAATAGVAAAALFGTAAATAQAATVNAADMAASIQKQIGGRAFGWQFTIAQDGKYVTSGKGGTAVSAKDAGGTSVPMQITTRMDIASATKTFTAIATMNLLRAYGLSVESRVGPILPSNWVRGTGFSSAAEKNPVQFKHLLSHTSGVNQAIVKSGNPGNGWVGAQTIVQNGTVAPSGRAYHNLNYVVLRVLNAELYKRIAGKAPVTQANQAAYGLEYMQRAIFAPAGVTGVSCEPVNALTAMRSYGMNATQSSQGEVHMGGPESCAGHRGLFLSSFDHARLLAYVRHGSIIHTDDLAKMDELRLGWDGGSNAGSNVGAFWHGGDLNGTVGDLHTCGATFQDGTEVSMMVNSPIASLTPPSGTLSSEPVGASTPCGIVLAAWKAAM